MNTEHMTEEMIEAAYVLEEAALEYRRLFIKEHGYKPIIWVKNDDSENSVLTSDPSSTFDILEFVKRYF